MALEYFKAAIVLMDPDCWQSEQYATTHFLYTNAVALSWVVGEYDFTEKYLDVIFQNTTDPLDRVAAYRIQYKYHFSRQMHIEGAMALHECLKELDIKDFKWSYTRTELDEEFERVKDLIDQRGFEEIKKVEVCEDIKLKAIMSVLEEM
ncbi:hypothetical protein G6F68_017442 [Rhizopus microsporus]|nr:hypothetical protein G6F68_017442 [Rhizopus microsporus]